MNETFIRAYKAFDKNFKCRGFQFEVGKTYTEEKGALVCKHGFHACRNPADVLNYYDLINTRFAEVYLSGEISENSGDTKLCASTIYILREISADDFTNEMVKYASDTSSSGDFGRLSASKYSGQLSAAGDYNQLSASGDYSRLSAVGHANQLSASGYSNQLSASGDYSQLSASGYSNQLSATGQSCRLSAAGDFSLLSASGVNSVISASSLGCHFRAAQGGAVAIPYKDKKGKVRFFVGYVGENIEADTLYFVNSNGNAEVVP